MTVRFLNLRMVHWHKWKTVGSVEVKTLLLSRKWTFDVLCVIQRTRGHHCFLTLAVPWLKMYVTCRVEGQLLASINWMFVFSGFYASIDIEILFLTSLSLPLIGLCIGIIPLGDDLTSLGDDIIIVALWTFVWWHLRSLDWKWLYQSLRYYW